MKRLLSLLAVMLIGGCASPAPISSSPTTTAVNQISAVIPQSSGVQSQIVSGLQDAAFNLDNAMAIGALPANDPASNCVHGVLKQLGADVTVTPAGTMPVIPAGGSNVTSFVPRENDLLGSGAVAYILIQQAKQLQAGGISASVPMGCTALVGQIVIDAAKLGIKVGAGAFSGGLTSTILPALP